MRTIHSVIVHLACWALLLGTSYGKPYDPNLPSVVDASLSRHGSPIAANGIVFFSSGLAYNVDPRLMVAISGAESSFGTKWAACLPSGFNAWSWFYNGNCPSSPFSSFADGIQTVTRGIRRLYLNKGRTTIPLIAAKYCASGCSSWIPSVTEYYTALGGDTTDLTFLTFSPPVAVSEFFNQNSFAAAAPSLTMASFNQFPIGFNEETTLALGDLVVTLTNAGSAPIFGDGSFGFTTNYLSTSVQDGGNNVVITASKPMSALGFTIVSVYPVSLSVITTNGSYFTVPSFQTGFTTTPGFLGFVSQSGITAVSISSPAGSSNTPIVNVGDLFYSFASAP